MKLTTVLLLTFASATWQQQNDLWYYPQSRPSQYYPLRFHDYEDLQDADVPIVEPRQRQQFYPNRFKTYSNDRQRPFDDSTQLDLQRSLLQQQNIVQRQKDANVEPKYIPFKWLTFKYLTSLISSSLSSTVYATYTTTVDITSTATCFASALFPSTAGACRRKRMPSSSSIFIDDNGDNNYFNTPYENTTASTLETQMPREGRDIDLALLLLSSQNENADADNRFFIRKPTESSVNRYIREKRFKSFINDV